MLTESRKRDANFVGVAKSVLMEREKNGAICVVVPESAQIVILLLSRKEAGSVLLVNQHPAFVPGVVKSSLLEP